MAVRARELADSHDLTGKHVFFNEKWVPYAERQNFLLDADVGVSTHFEHIETTFSFRTRILDYLWTHLPIVTTRGDGFGDLVSAEGLGVAVRESDPAALAAALELMLFDDAASSLARANVARVRQDFTWDKTLAPLIEFCRDPRPAPDRVPPEQVVAKPKTLVGKVRRDYRTARRYLNDQGVGALVAATTARLKRRSVAKVRAAQG